jgi:hypothetical protein
MLRKTGLILAGVLISVPVFADANMDITEPKMVAQLVELDAIISAISAGVMGCMDSGNEHKQCMCENKDLFAKFSGAANNFVESYPQLDDQDLVNFKNPDGVLVNLSLETAKRQADMKLSCGE